MTLKNNEFILFLDIDGVMNNWNYGFEGIDPENIYWINKLYEKYKFKIVLCSSRLYSSRSSTVKRRFKELKKLFKTSGIKAHVIGRVLSNKELECEKIFFEGEYITPYRRGHRIQHFNEKINFKGRFLIADDEHELTFYGNYEYHLRPYSDKVIHVDQRIGFQNKDIMEAIQLIEKQFNLK